MKNDYPARYYRCTCCDIIFAGDEWHQKCPKCGSYCTENGMPVRFYECYHCRRIYVGDEYHQNCPECKNCGREF